MIRGYLACTIHAFPIRATRFYELTSTEPRRDLALTESVKAGRVSDTPGAKRLSLDPS